MLILQIIILKRDVASPFPRHNRNNKRTMKKNKIEELSVPKPNTLIPTTEFLPQCKVTFRFICKKKLKFSNCSVITAWVIRWFQRYWLGGQLFIAFFTLTGHFFRFRRSHQSYYHAVMTEQLENLNFLQINRNVTLRRGSFAVTCR